ncbi:MAG: 50S ribosomal protein L11 [Nitrososphaeria archaeon]|jgi:large subunit ribosomal protein L11
MSEKKVVNVLITGGEANAGPPLGPALGPLGVNVVAIVKEINDITKEYAGMRVPVFVEVDTETKAFSIRVGIPTLSALLVKEAGIPKGAGTSGKDYVGNISFEQLIKVAKICIQKSYSATTRSAVCEVLGSCVSMGLKVDDKPPKQVLDEVKKGLYDEKLKEENGKTKS